MNTFSFRPSTCTAKKAPRRLTAGFGDGYEQTQDDGINVNLPAYDISFVDVPKADADAIDAFLDTDSAAFLWTPPFSGASQGVYKCEEWDRVLSEEVEDQSSFTMTFKRKAA